MIFADLNLTRFQLNALDDLNLTTPTAIQAKVFTPIMSGKDIVGIAQTGTGKTYAYLLPTLRLWKFSKTPFAQILIIVPTRELVAQVVGEINKLTTYMNVVAVGVYGGTNMRKQKETIYEGVDVVVGTPGRLVDLMLDGVLKTKLIKRLIIDEVDEMLHLGFKIQLKNIIDFLPKKRQNLMFSATLSEEVEKVIDQFTEYYQKIETAPSGAPLENISQFGYEVPNFLSKVNLLTHLLNSEEQMTKVLIFAATKKLADILFEKLSESFPESVRIIHSSKSQNYRFASVNGFDDGSIRCLIATDIIARGLDVSGVTHVINFDLTETAEQYIHRIGRTGRAENKGIAISFVSEKEQIYKTQIEALMDQRIGMLAKPEEVEYTEELIDIEKQIDAIPFNHHKMKQHEPSGPAFHEKKEKNKKVNNKFDYEASMKKKYKKQYRSKDHR